MITDPHLRITLRGTPRPQGSLKVMTNRNTGQPFGKYPPTTIEHRHNITAQLASTWNGNPPITVPVSISACFYLPRPDSHWRTAKHRTNELKASAPAHHTTTPDADKLARLVGDALAEGTGAGIIRDDKQIVRWRIEKRYITTREETPRTELSLWKHE